MVNRLSKIADPRWWDALSAFVLVCALLTAATRLVVTRWTDDLYIVQTLVFLGAILGLALGLTRFSPRVAFLISLGYTVVIIPWQLGLTITGDLSWSDRLTVMSTRMQSTVNLVLHSRPVNDNILFIFLMSCLFWILSVHAGYSLTRYGASWQVVLPIGLAILVIHSYDPYLARRTWFLAAYLLFGLILIARMNFVHQRRRWAQNRAHMPPDMGFDWIRFTLLVVVVLTLLAWTMPALAQSLPAASDVWQVVRRPWINLQARFSSAFSSLRSSVGVVGDYYGDVFSLSRGNSLSNSPVFTVDAPPRPTGVRFYWQAFVYNDYLDGQWKNSLNNNQVFQPGKPSLAFPKYPARQESTFTIKPLISIGTLYVPTQPVWVNRTVRIYYGAIPDGTADVVSIQAQPIVNANQTYQVVSSLSTVTEAQLRKAGTDYPQWVSQNYLQLPADITPRTRQLAQQLANGSNNPYDIATAVTNYLRTYKYSDVVTSPPSNQEVIDWWLFDYKQGFCQYYATAEIVLLRSLGIPARMAVGYAQGEYTPKPINPNNIPDPELFRDNGGTYTVRQKDSHAWPEVYFPGLGWIEFEPTASQDAVIRPSGDTNTLTGSANQSDNPGDRGPSRNDQRNPAIPTQPDAVNQTSPLSRFILPAIIIVLAIIILGIAFFIRRRYPQFDLSRAPIQLEQSFIRIGIKPPDFLSRWSYFANLSPIVRAYLEVNRALSRLGIPAEVHATPSERVRALTGIVPAMADPAQNLLDVYHLSVYGQRSVNEQAATLAGKEIRKLSYLALLQRIIARFQEPVAKFQR
ncbi:MAG: DUF4129 domain-containing transglutaminase family protein [Omnitrophica WOR_2 bacterium]